MTDIRGKIIILNGVSSSGKTTMARALQEHLEEPYYWLANDTFCDMCPDKFWDQDWVTAINQALTAMIYTVRTFSDIGMNVIVDQVFLNNDTEGQLLEKCIEVLHSYPVTFVRVDCSLEELERREKERSDRDIGQAKSQLQYIHNHHIYDCAIDTSANSVAENIAIVIAAVQNPTQTSAFRQLKQKLDQQVTLY
jgi:chloramphenicol 3-O phosphotransferase